MTKEKKKPWIRFRHRVVRNVLFPTLGTYSRLTYGIHIEKFREQGDRQYLILFNHQTAFDQFFVGMAFRGPVYYLASEDLFSNGWVSSVIRYLVAPIPIKKQTTDIAAVKRCLTVAKEGGTIAIAPEGNRTYSGKTEYINPAIVALAKKAGAADCAVPSGGRLRRAAALERRESSRQNARVRFGSDRAGRIQGDDKRGVAGAH